MTAGLASTKMATMSDSPGSLIERNAVIPTWFGIGGRADALARPATTEQLRALVREFHGQPIRILGDGANLLVDDDGVDGLVLSLERMDRVDWPADGAPGDVLVPMQAGASLFRIIPESVRRGLAGLETIAGIPATIGGAIAMNAGGAFGQIADVVSSVEALTLQGEAVSLRRDQIDFDYRRSGLGELVITGATLRLRRTPDSERDALRARLKEVMEYKKASQPMAERSAGCFFKNPTVDGRRVSAGMLIDQCGCKGLAVGGASVSTRHANFIVTGADCRARDILSLTAEVARRVRQQAGVELEREVVVWRRSSPKH